MGIKQALRKIEKNLDESFKEAMVGFHQRYIYSNILKYKAESPPAEVSRTAVNSVWDLYKGANCKWAQYYWSINGIASPYYIPTDI